MANEEHLKILSQGVAVWNRWRVENPDIQPALSGAYLNRHDLNGINFTQARLIEAHLRRANLSQANLSQANLYKAKLTGADLYRANLSQANLRRARLPEAKLREANLIGANLWGANLGRANLSRVDGAGADLSQADLTEADLFEASLIDADLSAAILRGASLNGAKLTAATLRGSHLGQADLTLADFSRADLSGANLRQAILVRTNFSDADLTGCSIYGIAAWDLNLTGSTRQLNLIISPPDRPVITVDNLEVAQFIYLLLHNEKLRDVIDTITSKAVLILGRFTPDRKAVLEAIRTELRRQDYVPLMFDFERPPDRDFTETMMTLAGLCRFIIADITNPRSSPLELQATVPNFRIPLVPILQEGEKPFAMFKDLYGKYDWVLVPLSYPNKDRLVEKLVEAVIEPALKKSRELTIKKAEEMPIRSL